MDVRIRHTLQNRDFLLHYSVYEVKQEMALTANMVRKHVDLHMRINCVSRFNCFLAGVEHEQWDEV